MCSGIMEPEEEKKKLNDDVVVFMRKRSETEAPHYTARLKTYLDIKQKQRRAAAARHHTAKPYKASTKEQDQKLPTDKAEHGNDDDRVTRRMGGRTTEKPARMHSLSRSGSAPSDSCGRQRRRRSRCRRRRRRCSRRRRRRSCRRRRRRRSCRRRRRRSCGRRRRRRRSCRRRRRRRSCRR